MENIKFEILIKEKEKIILARVLLKFDAVFKKYPEFGVWSYLINSKNGIHVFDVGPKFNTILGFRGKETRNSEIILTALEKLFPGKTIEQILLSHYHFDHSQTAPDLQKKVKKKYDNLPPIRIHKKDLEDKIYLKIFSNSLQKEFKKAGYKNWFIGKPIIDNERINNTEFYLIHSPGHTSGNMAIISKKYKVIIAGWWLEGIKNPIINSIQKCCDEDSGNYKSTIRKLRRKGYTHFTYHPKIEI